MLSERHELNKIALLELKKDVEETREFSSYFSKIKECNSDDDLHQSSKGFTISLNCKIIHA